MNSVQRQKLKELRNRWRIKENTWSSLDSRILNKEIGFAKGDLVFYRGQASIIEEIDDLLGKIKIWVIGEQRRLTVMSFDLKLK